MLRIIYYIYQLIIALPIILIATLLTALITSFGCSLFGSNFWGYYPGKIWSIIVCKVLLLPIHIEGKENIEKQIPYVFVANHQGAMDIFLLYGFIGKNFKWMMKNEIRKIPFVGYACYKAGFIFVNNKEKNTNLLETMEHCSSILSKGISMIVFPEGTRTADGKMRKFNKGAFFLADELQIPVIPITINGSFQVLPKTKGVGFVHRHPLTMTIHKPIIPTSKGRENIIELSRQSFDIINASLPLELKR